MLAEIDWTRATILFVTLIVSLTVHEAAHALFAKIGGDLTAYMGGQVTLNPVPHMRREPFGMVLLPILSIVISNGQTAFGFAHAPYDPIWAYHNPKKAALMAAAGPLANVLLAAIAFAVLYFLGRPEGDAGDAVQRIAMWFMLLNILLAVFNFIPLPPLDGASIVEGLVPATRPFYRRLARIQIFPLIVIILAINFLPDLFWPIFKSVYELLPFRRLPY